MPSTIVRHDPPEYRERLCQKAKHMSEALKELDFNNLNSVLEYLKEVNEIGYASADPVPEMIEVFAQHGFYPEMNLEYDENDETSFAGYIIGQALANNCDLIHVLPREWRQKFGIPEPPSL